MPPPPANAPVVTPWRLRLPDLRPRPSLVGRVVGAVLLAFALVAAVLVADAWRDYQRTLAEQRPLASAAQQLGTLLAAAGDAPGVAERLLRAAQAQSTQARREALGAQTPPLLFELRRRADGALLWASEPAVPLPAVAGPPQRLLVAGRRLAVAQADTPVFTLRLAEPQLPDTTVLGFLAREIAPSLALALPFVLLPVWLAVRRGLRPLQQLAQRLAARDADDLGPLGQDLRHAELQPVIRAFNQLLGQLADKVQRERAFVQDAAHELRTPMAVIAAQAHVLRRAADDAQRDQAAGALDAAIQRASHLAAQLLSLAALDDGRPAALDHVDLALLAQQALAQRVPLAARRGIELALDAPDALPLQLDRTAWLSVLGNLLDNALCHGRDGGQVQVSLAAHAGRWVLTVADDGPGIAAAERARVFERFVRGSQASVAGTGLGLAIVRQAARRLGGGVQLADGLPGPHGRGLAVVVHGRAEPLPGESAPAPVLGQS